MRARMRPARKSWEYRREHLPYGVWTCGDGRKVLFNRFYKPLYERSAAGEARAADRGERVDFTAEAWFYKDGTPEAEKRRAGVAALAAWGLSPP